MNTTIQEMERRKGCCDKALADGQSFGDGGGWVCCDGMAVACVWGPNINVPGTGAGTQLANGIIRMCAANHESGHSSDIPHTCTTSNGTRVGWNAGMTDQEKQDREDQLGQEEQDCNRENRDSNNGCDSYNSDSQEYGDCYQAIAIRNSAIDDNMLDPPNHP